MEIVNEVPTVNVAKTIEDKCSILRVLIEGLDYIMKYKNLSYNSRNSIKYIKQRFDELMIIPSFDEEYFASLKHLNKVRRSPISRKDLMYPKETTTIDDLRELYAVLKAVKEVFIKSEFSKRKKGLTGIMIRNTIRQLLNLNYLKTYNSNFNIEYKEVSNETQSFINKFNDGSKTKEHQKEFSIIMEKIIILMFNIGKIE